MIALALGAAAIALYLRGVTAYRRRFPARPFGALRVTSFVAGIAAMTFAVSPIADRYSDVTFTAHMLTHVLLVFVGPPLVLLGAPLLLLVAATPQNVALGLTHFASSAFGRALFAPLTGWLAFVFVAWGVHFSPLYEVALQYPAVHVAEHLIFVSSSFLFWNAVIQVGYTPLEIPFAARMLYIFLAIPQGAFVGFAIGSSNHVLYPHYLAMLGNAALEDQRDGADLMWILGGFALFTAFIVEAAAWARAERKAPA